jgi:hypothetical protein
MSGPRVEFGGKKLSDPAVSERLDHLLTANRETDERLQRERYEEIFVRAVAAWFRKTDR